MGHLLKPATAVGGNFMFDCFLIRHPILRAIFIGFRWPGREGKNDEKVNQGRNRNENKSGHQEFFWRKFAEKKNEEAAKRINHKDVSAGIGHIFARSS